MRSKNHVKKYVTIANRGLFMVDEKVILLGRGRNHMSEKLPYYHFRLFVDFKSGNCSNRLQKDLEALGFESFLTRGERKWRRFNLCGEDCFDLIMAPLLEEFALDMEDIIHPLLSEIEGEGGELSLVCVLYEHSELNNVAIQITEKTIAALHRIHCPLDFDRYLYTNDEKETYD